MTKTGHVYTPKETVMYERLIKEAWMHQVRNLQFPGPVEITMRFSFKRPKSHFLKDGVTLTKDAPIFMTNVPDMDNLEKAVQDGLNGVAFADDKQIVDKVTVKHYGEEDEIEVDVWGLVADV